MSSSGRENELSFYQQAVRLAHRVRLRRFPSLWNGASSSEEEIGVRERTVESNWWGLGNSADNSENDDYPDHEEKHDLCAEEMQKEVDEGKKPGSCSMERKDSSPIEQSIAHMTKTWSSPGQSYGHFVKNGMVHTVSMLNGREMNISRLGKWSRAECCHMAARYLPVDSPKIIDQMNSRVYVGQFSSDGCLFVGGFQERQIRIYNVEKGWCIKKDIVARRLRWTVTDTALSHDQRFLIYATISPIVHLVNVGNDNGVESHANITDIHEGLDFSMRPSEEHSLGLYSIQFSKDGREIVAGSNHNSLYIYDLETNRPITCLQAHKDDVNTVTYADETCHLIFSGSDDHTCKVWDRRCLVSKSRPAGILLGHLEGITFIDSRGDGRYFISNGKDQTIKLWDIRKMSSASYVGYLKGKNIPSYNWDYRWMDYPGDGLNVKHPNDQSLMTYRGHKVLRTLVRCYFSPIFSTGQKYIYTGSHDRCVYIYDLVTGEVAGKLSGLHRETVRDCSWHPFYPLIVSSSWDGKIVQWEHLHGDVSDEKYIDRGLTRCVLGGRIPHSEFSDVDEYITD